jgi:predicted DNA-binding transcriptional regulator YafY
VNRLERIHKIDEMITRQGTVAIDEFLSTLNVSLATFKRDLDYLRATLHAPVVWDRSRGGYSYGKRKTKGKAAAQPMPSLWAGAKDTHALLLAHGALSSVKSGALKEDIQGLCARLIALLSSHGDAPAQIARRLQVQLPAVADEHPLFAALASAVLKRRRIRLQSAGGKRRRETSTRVLSPVSLEHAGDTWVLHAFDHGSNAACSVALSDCEQVEVLNEKAKDLAVKSGR